jgi:hypothetical protein
VYAVRENGREIWRRGESERERETEREREKETPGLLSHVQRGWAYA